MLVVSVHRCTPLSSLELDTTTTMASFDSSTLASEAYALATSGEPIASLVKEALDVIDAALDEYGCAAHSSDDPSLIPFLCVR